MPVTMTFFAPIEIRMDADDAILEILLHFVPDMIPHSYIFGVTAYARGTIRL